MKQLILGILLTGFVSPAFTQAIRSIPYPEVLGRNSDCLSVERIDLSSEKTVLEVCLQAPNHGYVTLSPNVYLQDQDSPRRYRLTASEGFTPGAGLRPGQVERCRLTFEPLAPGTKRIHLQEGPNAGDFSITGMLLSEPDRKKRKAIPERIDAPETTGRNMDWLNVDRIEQTPTSTVLTITLTGQPGSSVLIPTTTYLQDNYSNRRYKLRHMDAGTPGQSLRLSTGWQQIRLCFEPLQPGTRTVDLIGSSDPSDLRIWGLHITERGVLKKGAETKTIRKPTETGRDNVLLYVEKIELTRKRAIFHMKAFGKGESLQINSDAYLQDNFSGNRYRLIDLESFPPNRPIRIPKEGYAFRLVFEPIRKGTRTVDMLLQSGWRPLHIWGVGINEQQGERRLSPEGTIDKPPVRTLPPACSDAIEPGFRPNTQRTQTITIHKNGFPVKQTVVSGNEIESFQNGPDTDAFAPILFLQTLLKQTGLPASFLQPDSSDPQKAEAVFRQMQNLLSSWDAILRQLPEEERSDYRNNLNDLVSELNEWTQEVVKAIGENAN